ncbi:MAG TPA: hypothetical protein VKA31_11025 [Mariprofundaceae bacterium]|nr:hypothetical protein [Mariprofundaceae bacterium]
MKRMLSLYPYIAPAILAPLSGWLWYRESGHDLQITLMAWLLPILWAYILPGVGTNVLKLWEFDTRFKLGRFRPHHGFVFGSATSMLAWLVHTNPATSVTDALQYAFILAGVLGFWNILYEILAIEAGILKVYNQPWADGKGAEAIALDYSPWTFGGFGAAYGFALALSEWWLHTIPLSWPLFGLWFTASLAFSIALPVWGFTRRSLARHGHKGTQPVEKQC